MIWPFKRKPKIIDRGGDRTWAAGNKAECVRDNWWKSDGTDPAVGDILAVVNVHEGVADVHSVRAVWLTFKSMPTTAYEANAFRKIVDTDDAAMIERIKAAAKPKRVRA